MVCPERIHQIWVKYQAPHLMCNVQCVQNSCMLDSTILNLPLLQAGRQSKGERARVERVRPGGYVSPLQHLAVDGVCKIESA